jgi:short-subunit dehydrogenase/catechol 2,3-dioxygenase-like lactoylglutathione lyase family enzyme
MRLSQIAVSVADVRRSQAWYRQVLGLEPAGGTNLFFGPIASRVQGVPRAASTCWWLVDRQEQMQLELFEFRSPPVRPLPAGWRPCDVGYTTVAFHVRDLEAVLARAAAAGTAAPGAPGEPGSRRACLRDPDGVLVELLEEDPRGPTERPRPRDGLDAVARAVILSVPDLERARRTFVDVLGLEPAGLALHGPEHEALWGLEGARSERLSLWADDFLVELAQYAEPAGRGLPPGYRISDLGLLNVAFGFRDRASFERAYERCLAGGMVPNGEPVRLGAWSVVYVNDPDGFSVELLHVEPWYEGRMGFRPRPTPRLAPFAGRGAARPRETAFRSALVTGAAGGIGREVVRLLAADGTALVLLDRDAAGLEELARELDGSVEVDARAVDMADLEALDAVMADVAAAHPDLDLLVACAGLDRAQSLLAFDWRQAQVDITVNATSNLVLLQHLAPLMAGRGGHVTAVSSLAGLVGMPYEAPYSASKAALATMVESARAELAEHGITFTAVFPGFVDTPMFRANAFRHTYSIEPRDAAERIHAATLRRRPTLHFPARERAKLAVGRLLPVRLRDRLTRAAMNRDRASALEDGADGPPGP